jgi:tetratricopeptide (TPR) repeat protein
MGWMYSLDRDWVNAEKSFQRAIQLNPSLTESYTSYSTSTLRPLRKFDEALRVLSVARRNDPFSLDVQREIGTVQFLAGEYKEAVVTLQHVHTLEPDFPFVESWLGRALTFAGRPTEALAMLERLDGRNLGRFKPASTPRSPWLAQAYVKAGRRAEAEALAAGHSASPSTLAIVDAVLGDKDAAFEALDRMAAIQPQHVAAILVDPELAALRGDPRLSVLRERFHLPTEQ